MALVQKIQTLRTPINASISSIVSQFNSLFSGIQANIQSITFSRPKAGSSDSALVFRVAYTESSVGLGLSMLLFQSDDTTSAQDKFNAHWELGACEVPLFILDVTDRVSGMTHGDTLVAVVANTARVGIGGLWGHEISTFIGEATAPIAPGATVNCDIYNTHGILIVADVPVTNVSSTDSIQATERFYCVYDRTAGLYMGSPNCPAAPVALLPDTPPPTTTGPQPCPSHIVASSDPREVPP